MDTVRQVAWITGGGTGIGRSLARLLAADGWDVAVSGRRPEPLEETLAAAAPGRVHAYPLDVTDTDAVQANIERIEAELGPVSLAIINAGIADSRPGRVDIDDYVRHIEINYLGAVRCVAALEGRMRQRGTGRFVLISSIAGIRGLPAMASYAASKAALTNFAESLQGTLLPYGIGVTVATPGFVDTPMTADAKIPMPFLVPVDKAASRILAAVHGKRYRVAFPWPSVWLVRLLRLFPDRLYARAMSWRPRRASHHNASNPP